MAAPGASKKTSGSWRNKKILITAGPTREALDPVRFLTNVSSGLMGYALAEQARRLGARVALVSGPTALKPPRGVQFTRVVSARDMLTAVLRRGRDADVVVGAAAVADWRPQGFSRRKLKKHGKAGRSLFLRLRPNPDILKSLARRRGVKKRPVLVGFALETENLIPNAQRKMKEKSLDMIVANPHTVIHRTRTRAYLLRKNRPPLAFRGGSKAALARKILSVIAENHFAVP